VADRRLLEEVNRRVTREELLNALEQPIGADERERVLELVEWFTRRYPTGEARLAYARQAYRRWRRP
jgi:hypothetical protein